MVYSTSLARYRVSPIAFTVVPNDVYLVSSPVTPFKTSQMSSSPLPLLSELVQRKSCFMKRGSPNESNQYFSGCYTSATAVFLSTPKKGESAADSGSCISKLVVEESGPTSLIPQHIITEKRSTKKPSIPTEGTIRKPMKKPRKTTAVQNKDKEAIKSSNHKRNIINLTSEKDASAKEPGVEKDLKKTRNLRAKKIAVDRAQENTKIIEKLVEYWNDLDDDNAEEGKELEKKRASEAKRKKIGNETQTKLPKGRVSKALLSTGAETLSKFKQPAICDIKATLAEPLDLVDAIKRRTNWTPPTDADKCSIELTPTDIVPDDLGNGSLESEKGKKGFSDLFGKFALTKSADPKAHPKAIGVKAATRKRKLIEPIKTNASGNFSNSSLKENIPRKKARTITDQATSAYTSETTKPAQLLQHFSADRITANGLRVPNALHSRSPNTNSNPQKLHTGASKLLSPESALERISNQDFVFGTSSQLGMEDSPDFLRDIHEVMQTSNEVEKTSLDSPFTSPTLKTTSLNNNLWAAASRDSGGSLVDFQIIDLLKSSPLPLSRSEFQNVDDVQCDIGSISSVASNVTNKKKPKSVGRAETAIRETPYGSPISRKVSVHKDSAPKKARTQKEYAEPIMSSKVAQTDEMPDFQAYTTARLAKEISSYHFKPVKKREQMIILLQQCWEAKQRMKLATIDANRIVDAEDSSTEKPPTSAQIATSPKQSLGRPRKDNGGVASPKTKVKKQNQTDTVQPVGVDCDAPPSLIRTPKKLKDMEVAEEVSKSGCSSIATPRHRRFNKTRSASTSPKIQATKASPELSTSNQQQSFHHITCAVTSASPSKDPLNPSWHEKILLYDPIVLEDLTVWLNTGALQKVNWDGEVEPKDVKKWCESKSICCLWRENLRGGTRPRH